MAIPVFIDERISRIDYFRLMGTLPIPLYVSWMLSDLPNSAGMRGLGPVSDERRGRQGDRCKKMRYCVAKWGKVGYLDLVLIRGRNA